MDNTKYDKLKEFNSAALLSYLSEGTLKSVYKDVMVEMFLADLADIIYQAEVSYPEGRDHQHLIEYDEDEVREQLTKLLDDL